MKAVWLRHTGRRAYFSDIQILLLVHFFWNFTIFVVYSFIHPLNCLKRILLQRLKPPTIHWSFGWRSHRRGERWTCNGSAKLSAQKYFDASLSFQPDWFQLKIWLRLGTLTAGGCGWPFRWDWQLEHAGDRKVCPRKGDKFQPWKSIKNAASNV